MPEHWKVRLCRWICAHIGHRWRPCLDEHGKPYANLLQCRLCPQLELRDKTRYANGQPKSIP